MLNLYTQHPDDDTPKLVQVQAFLPVQQTHTTDRHVLLLWVNATLDPGTSNACEVIQMTQLTGGVGGFGYFAPLAQKQVPDYRAKNAFWDLGVFTRKERDKILELAERVEFRKESRVNNCQTWLRDLLMMMVDEGMIEESVFEDVDKGVPFKRKRPELDSEVAAAT